MQNKKIILVERQADERAILKTILTDSSFEVLDFSDSMGAIQWVMENGNPNLLILEESSIPLNGLQTMDYMRTELKKEHPTLIALESDTHTTARKLQGFLKKPYSDKTLKEVENFLNDLDIPNEAEKLPKAYSLDYLIDLSDGNKEFISESLALFKVSVSEKLIELETSIDQRHFEEVRKIAHSIKPSFDMLLNQKGKELCQRMEHSKDDEELSALVQELKLEYQLIQNQITVDTPIEKI
ncbi:Hpt domain-containing protein [Arenibacter latericius]|uniref:Hpt domain-containing protein n=1 Tax=Arenibacter latericius TaxID=86104 RepID=UPI000414ADDB|nr:Hpt domain-containing protein [Arenibacter latericius]